jgi:hypothetical protein
LVDTFEGWSGHSREVEAVASGEPIRAIFYGNIQRFGLSNYVCHVHEMTGVEAAALYAPASVDSLFLDGDHSPANVRAELAAWRPKLRPGAVLAGHDYFKTSREPIFVNLRTVLEREFGEALHKLLRRTTVWVVNL